jgi:hypothetical protein
MIDPVIVAGLIAAIASSLLLIASLRHPTDITEYRNKEEELSRQVAELKVEIERVVTTYTAQIESLKADVAALQRMLLDKERRNTELQERVRDLEKAIDHTPKRPRPEAKPNLVVVVGQDTMLKVDIARLRGIESLRLSTIVEAKMSEVQELINERRSMGRPVKYLHISTHSGPQGVAFADGLADAEWLSNNLKDVEVLVLAGCSGYRVASLLSIVPFVVSMRDTIQNTDASTFSYHFWYAIGEGQPAEDAFYYALKKSNAIVSEMAEFHSYT